MEKSAADEKLRHQYDALIKKVLKNEAKSYLRELSIRSQKENAIAEVFRLSPAYKIDHYQCEFSCFQIGHHNIYVEDEHICDALNLLTERQRIIILLFYFENMSDSEIAVELNLVRSTVFRHRKNALERIKKELVK